MPDPTHAILLAAGKGTRMWPLTETRPKPALPIAGTPLIARLTRQIANAGIQRLTLVTHSEDNPITRITQREAKQHGIDLTIHVQHEQHGTGHALETANPPPDEATLVTYGDLYLADDALPNLIQNADNAAIAARRVDDVSQYGALRTDDETLVGIDEKPDTQEDGLVNAGVYIFPPGFANHLDELEESPRGELELTDALQASLDEGTRYTVHTFDTWRDVGWPWDLLGANQDALSTMTPRIDGDVHPSAEIHGPVHIAENATVRAGCVIEGPVKIMPGASVGPNAYVRGATTLGPGAKIGHGCEVKNSVLFEGAKVPHVSYVGDSILGREVNLGAGTQVANLRHDGASILVDTPKGRQDSGRRKLGVVLGDGVKTGINASLNVGVMLGPGELVGPGATVAKSKLPGG